jgi:hypothetical protein
MRVCAPLESDTCCHVDAVRLVSSMHGVKLTAIGLA